MRNLSSLLALLLLLGAALACSFGDETSKANELVAEANKAVEAANDAASKADKKSNEMHDKADKASSEAELQEARAVAKELLPLYDTLAGNFQKASDKFDAASKVKIDDKFKEYLETKAKEMKKRAEFTVAIKGIPQTLIDSENYKTFKENAVKLGNQANIIAVEANALGEKADKLAKDNTQLKK